MCIEHGVAAPEASFSSSLAEVEAFSTRATFPVIAKVVNPWERLRSPAVRDARMIRSAEELVSIAATWSNPEYVMLQEYLPQDSSEDWIFHGYFDERSECLVGFTGVKYRSWPPISARRATGGSSPIHACSRSRRHLRQLGYRGSSTWTGASTGVTAGTDSSTATRAWAHSFGSSRTTPASMSSARSTWTFPVERSLAGDRSTAAVGFVVENRDLPAIFGYRRGGRASPSVPHAKGRVETAWFAWDDPLPFVADDGASGG